jgi:Outer membrane protein beta-barrel domain
MVRRIATVLAGIWLLAQPLSAQKVEVSFNAGYTLSEGIQGEERNILGLIYDRAEVNSGGSFHFTVGFFVNPKAQVEFLYGRQSSELSAEGVAPKQKISDLDVNNYHGNFVYNWGEEDAKVRPFAFIGLGATNYSFGTGPAGQKIEGETKFSTTWGGGVKFYVAPKVGVKFTARWTPTYIKSSASGYWCDPFYGCWVLGDPDYSHQFDLSGGVTIRF